MGSQYYLGKSFLLAFAMHDDVIGIPFKNTRPLGLGNI